MSSRSSFAYLASVLIGAIIGCGLAIYLAYVYDSSTTYADESDSRVVSWPDSEGSTNVCDEMLVIDASQNDLMRKSAQHGCVAAH